MTITVQKGDTLWSLAAKHLSNPVLWKRLYAANREAIERAQRPYRTNGPDWIYPGTKLTVPGG
jgi:nucleoid-associated protein YgaU